MASPNLFGEHQPVQTESCCTNSPPHSSSAVPYPAQHQSRLSRFRRADSGGRLGFAGPIRGVVSVSPGRFEGSSRFRGPIRGGRLGFAGPIRGVVSVSPGRFGGVVSLSPGRFGGSSRFRRADLGGSSRFRRADSRGRLGFAGPIRGGRLGFAGPARGVLSVSRADSGGSSRFRRAGLGGCLDSVESGPVPHPMAYLQSFRRQNRRRGVTVEQPAGRCMLSPELRPRAPTKETDVGQQSRDAQGGKGPVLPPHYTP